MILKTHLVFPGTCEQALDLYKDALGGEIVFTFRKKEDKTMEVKPEDSERISHMILKTPFFELAGEDINTGEVYVAGDSNKLVLSFTELDRVRPVFDKLAEGGTITMPLQKIFFSEAFGELTDAYGIHWVIMMSDDGYEG